MNWNTKLGMFVAACATVGIASALLAGGAAAQTTTTATVLCVVTTDMIDANQIKLGAACTGDISNPTIVMPTTSPMAPMFASYVAAAYGSSTRKLWIRGNLSSSTLTVTTFELR